MSVCLSNAEVLILAKGKWSRDYVSVPGTMKGDFIQQLGIVVGDSSDYASSTRKRITPFLTNERDVVLFLNLRPKCVDEALLLIPSLRLLDKKIVESLFSTVD